jgi:hypothetical protein
MIANPNGYLETKLPMNFMLLARRQSISES